MLNNPVDSLKSEILTTVESDGRTVALKRADAICRKRQGKFKISEREFCEEMETLWVQAEFSAAERIMRAIEVDKELNSRDLVVGEIQTFLVDLYKVLKKKLGLKENVELQDLLWGNFTTEKVLHQYIRKNTEAKNAPTSA